ncbi:MAG: anthranilate synthase component I [Clostridium sp.]|nr:anthranilate synthase component I [Clostridium sp.]
MFNIDENEFLNYKKKSSTFPVMLKMNGDELTIVSIYYKLKGENKFLLESVYSENEIGRYSFVGSNPYLEIKSFKDKIFIKSQDETKNVKGRVLDYVEKYTDFNYENNLFDVPFTGGAVGYVGYDVIRQYEKLLNVNEDDLKIPEAYLMFYKDFICFDHFKNEIYIVHNVFKDDKEDFKSIKEKLINLRDEITEDFKIHPLMEVDKNKKFESNITKQQFTNIVEKAKQFIKAGDIFQVVLSQRLKFKLNCDPFDVYRRLRSKNPSPYLFYFDFEENFKVAGSSPESLVSVIGDTVTTNPIAGTRPRGKNKEDDEKLENELIKDEKERAEHLMLVDLGRNDIGKISEFGSVKIDKLMEIQKYSHVMHIASKVSGKLKSGFSSFDALSSCLPVGTVSGAPKVRAMEIIDELENTKRGIYAGAVGYFSYNKNMDTCIAIRTMVFKDDFCYVQSGAGIVYDSNPENEYIETLNKAMAMKEVI